MTLNRHITHLLYSHDCVVVPGFGAFVAKSFSAELNTATQMFMPPGRRLSFQPGLRADDGLLLKHIARVENRSVDVVRLQVSDAVSHWHAQLHRGERVRIEDLGLFYIDRQGELQFKPQIDFNYDANFFGLGVFRATPVVSIADDKRVVPLHERKDRNRSPFWRAAAVAAGVAGLLTIGGVKSGVEFPMELAGFDSWFKSDSSETEEEVTSSEETPSAPAETTTEVSNERTESEFPEVAVETTPVAVSPVEVGQYYVIVGSFVEKANADDLHNELSQKGYDPLVLPFDGKYNKVAIQAYSSREAAISGLRKYKKDVQRGAWIYRK